MAGAKTTVQESTISGVTDASVNDLLTEKPMGAMVLGGARELVAEKIKLLQEGVETIKRREAERVTMLKFLNAFAFCLRDDLKITNSLHGFENLQPLSLKEFDSLIEYCAELWRRKLGLHLPFAGFFIPLLWHKIFSNLYDKDAHEFFPSLFCFYSYRKLKEFHGDKTNQKIYEALHPSDNE